MCRNYELSPEKWKMICETLRVELPPPLIQKTLFRTTNDVPVVRVRGGKREAALLRWGLIPRLAQNEDEGRFKVNARAETIEQKLSYQIPFLKQRCLLPATAFWEFREISPRVKEPHRIWMKDGSWFAIAGIWETWKADDGKVIESCSMVTTEPNELIRRFHDRMPVILPEESWDTWLSETEDVAKLKELLVSYASELMEEEIRESPLKDPNKPPKVPRQKKNAPASKQRNLFD